MAEIIKFIYLMILFISLLVVLTDIVASITIYPCKPFFLSFWTFLFILYKIYFIHFLNISFFFFISQPQSHFQESVRKISIADYIHVYLLMLENALLIDVLVVNYSNSLERDWYHNLKRLSLNSNWNNKCMWNGH
jgi:hypothetical protein